MISLWLSCRNAALASVLLGLVTGCGTHAFVFRDDVPGRLVLREEQPYVLYGLWQHHQIDAALVCGGAENVVKLVATYDFIDTAISVLSANVYYPLRAKVYCAE